MARRVSATTALAVSALMMCGGAAAWSAPGPTPRSVHARPGPVLSTHLDYGKYVVSVDPARIEGAASGAPEGIRTPNLLIRSQMLYPLSYGRSDLQLWLGLAGRAARRLRDLNPGWGVTPNRISSAAP